MLLELTDRGLVLLRRRGQGSLGRSRGQAEGRQSSGVLRLTHSQPLHQTPDVVRVGQRSRALRFTHVPAVGAAQPVSQHAPHQVQAGVELAVSRPALLPIVDGQNVMLKAWLLRRYSR